MLKMSGNLISYFALLLLLLSLLMSCGGVSGDAAEAFSYKWRDMTDSDGTLSALRGPSVVNLENEMVVVAEGHVKKRDGDTEIPGVMSGIMKERGDETRTELSLTSDDVKSGTRILEDTPTKGGTKTHNVMGPTTVVTENNIYMLLTKGSAEGQPSGDEAKSLLLVSGSLGGAGDGAKKQVTWSDTKVATPQSTPTYLTQLVTSGGSGIAMEKDNRVAFPIQATKGGENVLLVMYGSVNDNKWKLSTEIEDVEDCSDPAIVEWEEGKFLMITPCAKGSYDVYMSTYLGRDWMDSDVPLTRVWGTSRDRSGSGVRSGFITTTIEKRKVLLVTLPVYSEEENGKGQLHLFLTDNAHVYDVGPVSPEGDNAAASNLLYTNDNRLTVVYEKKDTDASTATSLVSVRLTEQLKQIKSVVQTWDEVDKSLKECTSDNRKLCSRDVSTKGLAGFLSGTHTGNVWKDEYLCVNATVKGAVTKTEKGLKFQGTGAGAEWPVGQLGQNQPYYFANNQFTLVATVTIHRVPTAGSSPIPLIGVKMNDTANMVLFGLSYTHEKKWVLVFNNTAAGDEDEETWEKGKEYQVALSMKVNEWSVYIDGEKIYDEEKVDDASTVLDKIFEHNRISHFYIGGDGDASMTGEGIDVTVENVLLYNHKLYTGDINKLKCPKSVSSFENDEEQGDTSESSQEAVQGTGAQEQSPEASPSLDTSSPNAPEKTLDNKPNGGSAGSQGATRLSPLNGESGAERTASDTTTKEEESQEQHEESPPPKNDTGKDSERLEEVSEVKGNTLREETDDETTPRQTLPLDDIKEEDDGEEEKPSGATDKEETIIVKDAGYTNANETTPSGLDNHDNVSSRGSDEASTSGENNVSNADTPQRSADEKNEETLEGIEPTPGAHREGNANPIAASSPPNNTSVDSKNVTDLVARLTNNDSAARESLTRGLLLLFLGLCTVLSLC